MCNSNYITCSVAALVTYQPRHMHPAMLPFAAFGTLRPVYGQDNNTRIERSASRSFSTRHTVCVTANTIYRSRCFVTVSAWYLDGSNIFVVHSTRAFLACLDSFVYGICNYSTNFLVDSLHCRAGASGVDALRAVGPCLFYIHGMYYVREGPGQTYAVSMPRIFHVTEMCIY